jgi:RNA polymerase sigma factor (sigma-70 family)
MGSADSRTDKEILLQRMDARFRAPLMSYFLRRLGNRAEAEDFTQQVFLRIVGAETRLPFEQADGLIFTIAGNLLRDRSRRVATRDAAVTVPLDPDMVDRISRDDIEDSDAERVLLARDTLEAALAALDRLGQRTKDIFILTRLENMKQAEVARLMGVSVSTVEKSLVRAATHLALCFAEEMPR